MDRGLAIPRYRPDLGIGKSYIDYDMLENPTVDTSMSTSFSLKTPDSPPLVIASSARVNYPKTRNQQSRSAGQRHDEGFDTSQERFKMEKPATRLEKDNSNPSYEGHISPQEKRRSPSSEREISDPFSFEAISERLKPLMVITQECGHQFTIKCPRYSDPSLPIESKHCRRQPDLNHESSTKLRNGHDNSVLGLENAEHVSTDQNSDARKDTHKVRHRSPTNSKLAPDDTSEDTMKDPRLSPSGLPERSQQAWKIHRHKNSNLRSNIDPKAPRSTNTVSFKGKDSVQYFEPHIEELPDDMSEENTDELGDDVTDDVTEETGYSFDDRSLNSEYTKGLESEVEDMIKDIFFIGNPANSKPGRRKYRYKHDVKKRLRDKGEGSSKPDVSDFYLSTERQTAKNINTYHDPDKRKGENLMNKQQSKRGSKPSRSETQPKTLSDMSEAEAALWNFVEGGVTAVSSALGFNGEETATQSQESQREQSILGNTCTGPILPFEPCPGRVSSSKARPDLFDYYDYPRDVAYNPLKGTNFKQAISESDFEDPDKHSSKSSSSTEDLVQDEADEATEEQLEETRNLPFSVESLGEDPELLELAQHAARSLHQSHGLEYDESNVISMHKDLQISVVELKLPLGLVFLENDGGCFVKQVSPEGSAARSGGVEVGDQLAYINGNCSIRMTVEGICEVISKARNPNCIELVLFRYVGPMCPKKKPMAPLDKSVFDEAEITIHSPETYGHRSTFQLVSAYPPKEYVPKKKGFRFFGRTRLPIARK